MDRVTPELANAEILDTAGSPHKLSELWAKAPALLVFVRHFGCIFCHQQVMELAAKVGQFSELGVGVAVIGNGSPSSAAGFRDRVTTSFSVYSDEKRASFDAAGMRRGLSALLDPRLIPKAIKAWSQGGRQIEKQGDATQQGGILVVLPDGRIAYRHVNRYPGDHADLEEIIFALEPSFNKQ